MLFSSFLAAATLALTATALPTFEEGKPFKIALVVNGKTTYLSQSGAAVSDAAQAASCTIQQTALSCGGKAVAFPVIADMVQLKPGSSGNNKGWSVKADGTLDWKSNMGELRFGERTDSARYKNQIWAENCHDAKGEGKHGHSFAPGVAKAVY